MSETFNWGRFSPEAEAAWNAFNRTGDRSEVLRIISVKSKGIKDPRRLWAVFLFTLTQARADAHPVS